MKDVDESLDTMQEAKKFSLQTKINVLQQLVLQRFQSLTTISAISFAVVGILISTKSDFIENQTLAISSFLLLVVVALVSLGRHLFLVRSDIEAIARKIKELPDQDWSVPLKKKEFRADYWPETLYVALILGILLFSISLI